MLCVKRDDNGVFEAPDPHGMVATSSPNICNVVEIVHKLRMSVMVIPGLKQTLDTMPLTLSSFGLGQYFKLQNVPNGHS